MANDRSPERAPVPPVIANNSRREPVLVIGAGSSGLVAAVELQRRGVQAEILERNDTIGSAWLTRYDRLRLNTCRWNSALSRDPFPKGTPVFPSRDDFVRYLGAYAKRHQLPVHYGVEVKRIDRGDGKWRLATSEGERTASQVIISTGYLHTPRRPDWPALDLYPGRLLHSAEYRNAEPFRNADVLVVGAGCSAMDIATDLAHGGAGRVRIAVRSQPNLLRRAPLGLPSDLLFTVLFRLSPQRADRIDRILRRITIGTLAAQGLTVPDEGPYSRCRRTGSGPTIVDKAVFRAIRSRRIEIVAGVSSVDAEGVRLIDGALVRPDIIIAATGFSSGLTELVGHLGVLDDRGLPLASGGPAALPGLRFSGFVANIRPQYKDALRVAEQVARELIPGSQLERVGVMYTYVINLARSPERRVYIAAQLQRIGIAYEFVDGVDGADLDLADPRVIDPSVLETDWFRPGIAGCAFSHLRVYEKILADNLDWALVLEDDAKLPKDLASLAEAVAGHMNGAEVVLLNFLSPDVCKMSRHSSTRLPSSRQLVLPVDVNGPGSSAAYIITRDACKRMVESIAPFMARPDNWGYFFDKAAIDRVRCVMPRPVQQDSAFPSTIEYHHQARARVRDMILGYDLGFVNRILAYRRAWIGRRFTRAKLVDEPFAVKPSRLD